MPPLPKQYRREEAKITTLVLGWFLDNYPEDVAIEVKILGNKTLPHQDLALEEVRCGRFKYKIADTGRRNPFDGIVLKKGHPFVVTCDGMTCEAHNLRTDEKFLIKLKTARGGLSK